MSTTFLKSLLIGGNDQLLPGPNGLGVVVSLGSLHTLIGWGFKSGLLIRFAKDYLLPIAYALLKREDAKAAAWLCVAVSFAWTLVSFYPSLYYQTKARSAGYNNAEPRTQASRQRIGLEGRLWAAHLNQGESFPGFAAAVTCATLLASTNSEQTAAMACLHVACRTAYWLSYVAGIPNLRTVTFVSGFHCCLWIFIKALFP